MIGLGARAGLTQYALRILVNGRMHIRAHVRLVTVFMLRRLGGMVAATRVMMVIMTPGGGAPIRDIATGIQQVDGENG